jgi:hypothetical protein
LFKNSDSIKTFALAAIKLFHSNPELILRLTCSPQTPDLGKLLFMRVCALQDFNGTILDEVFAVLSAYERILMLGFLLEIDGWDLEPNIRSAIHLRNVDIFNTFAPKLNAEDALLFFTLNDWKFGAKPFDFARFDDPLLEGPFSCFQLQFAKTAVQSGNYHFLNPKFYPHLITENMNELKSDWVFRELMEQNIEFNLVMEKHIRGRFNLKVDHFDGVMPYYMLRYQAILKQRCKFKPNTDLRVVFDHASSPEILHSLLRLTQLDHDVVTFLFNTIFQIRGQREDIYDWIKEIFKICKSRNYRHPMIRYDPIHISPCPLSVVFKMFAAHELHEFLLSSDSLSVYFAYFNFEAIFDQCIRTDLHYNRFMSYPNLISNFNLNTKGFHAFILRCDSLDAVRRLFTLVRLNWGHPDLFFPFLHLVRISKKNPVNRILSLKWALLFWRNEDSGHFNAHCPEAWRIALNYQ